MDAGGVQNLLEATRVVSRIERNWQEDSIGDRLQQKKETPLAIQTILQMCGRLAKYQTTAVMSNYSLYTLLKHYYITRSSEC